MHILPWLPDCNRFLSVPAQALVLLQADDAVGEQSCKMSVLISHQEDASKSREASAASCKADGIVLHPVGVLHHLQQQAGA